MGRGRTPMVLKIGSDVLFLTKKELLGRARIASSTLNRRLKLGDFFSIRNGAVLLILNPEADFEAAWDSLPPLLSYEDVCRFFCVENICGRMARELGFFRIIGEKGLYIDKQTLADFLMLYNQEYA